MARHIPFPVRSTYGPPRSYDSLARDTQGQAYRIAEQIEREVARQAQRMSTGVRHSGAKVLSMPIPVRNLASRAWWITAQLAAIAGVRRVFRFQD